MNWNSEDTASSLRLSKYKKLPGLFGFLVVRLVFFGVVRLVVVVVRLVVVVVGLVVGLMSVDVS